MGRTTGIAWRNWAGTYSVTPARTIRPASVEQLAQEVRRAAEDGLSVKAIGAGHSFTDIGLTRGLLLKLDRLSGVLTADPASGLVTVAAGTTLRELNADLWQRGLALTNLGDVDAQTVSGAISTGTHGTGRRFGGLATQVRGLQLVDAGGHVSEVSPERDPELFDAARLGLGALGIITAVTLQAEPAFLLHAVEGPARLADVLELLPGLESNDHIEFYWFPHTGLALTKINNRLPGDLPAQPLTRFRGWLDDEFLSNTVFGGLNRLTTLAPRLIPPTNRLAARALSEREYTDRSYRVFVSPRRVVFREMEYAIPRAALSYVLEQIQAWLQRSGEWVGFPVEVRIAAADDIPLSTAYGRDSAYVAVHQYHRRPHDRFFAAVEAIAREVQGRPHWGKLHYQTADTLAELYPRFNDFLTVRDRVDPDRRFGNDYLRRVLGS